MASNWEFRDIEISWFAIDKNEHVALFVLAGGGPIPKEIDFDVHHAIDGFLRSELVRNSDSTTLPLSEDRARRYSSFVKPDFSFWEEMSAIGLYGFDMSCTSYYELLTVPSVPLRYENLPETVLNWMSPPISLPVEFCNLKSLNPVSYVECKGRDGHLWPS
jgi:hypothetical protein